jgi:hypothetical protein
MNRQVSGMLIAVATSLAMWLAISVGVQKAVSVYEIQLASNDR